MARLALVAIAIAACGNEVQVPEDTTAGVAQSTPAGSSAARSSLPVAVVGAAETRCPPTGRWAVCAVLDRLERAGLAPRLDSVSVAEPPLTPTGTRVRVGNADLELYVYPDGRSRERDQGLLGRDRYVPFDAPLPLRPVPTLIPSANLIAILHSRNDHLRERVADAILAGPPQPPTQPPSRPPSP